MMKENKTAVRIAHSRDKVSDWQGGVSLGDCRKHGHGMNSKRGLSDENNASASYIFSHQHKRRDVLKDVTNNNLSYESNYICCLGAFKNQGQEVEKTELDEDLSLVRIVETKGISLMMKSDREEKVRKNEFHNTIDHSDLLTPISSGSERLQMKDSYSEDPQSCTLYAHDIYDITRVTELDQRPSSNYMEELQKHINPIMRGILIDWLVEVSEEYKLVSDTLYLTVNLLDRFLSQSYIERQSLQLLGVTCMLIASKYEELCAPCAEDFCFITDNSYTRGEVLKMEGEVLNLLNFQLSVPTTKTFLRRFVQVAQASCKDPCIEFEYLTDYLAELTLVEYSFLTFLPSAIAASVVFLARWILNEPNHPWNPTLEHYTNYNASELRTPVLALEDLQLNSNGWSLNSIFQKYRQQKFSCVATLSSTKSVLSVFQRSS